MLGVRPRLLKSLAGRPPGDFFGLRLRIDCGMKQGYDGPYFPCLIHRKEICMDKVRLVGCQSYSIMGERYEHGVVTLVSPSKYEILMARKTDTGMPFFQGVPSATVATAQPENTRKGTRKGKVVAPPEPSVMVVEDESDVMPDDFETGVGI